MITIVDYKAGNLTSVRLAFEAIGVEAQITRDPEVVADAKRVVFPGVGAAKSAMEHLRELELIEALKLVISLGRPFLGICLGTQVICDWSEEDGGVECLGIVPGNVRRFQTEDPLCKIPQMGWNHVEFVMPHPLFRDIKSGSEFYFVHSYYPAPADPSYTLAETEYAGTRFASILGKGNLAATQFHPERSGRIGLQFLTNFARWEGLC